jgi:hypothetical protein
LKLKTEYELNLNSYSGILQTQNVIVKKQALAPHSLAFKSRHRLKAKATFRITRPIFYIPSFLSESAPLIDYYGVEVSKFYFLLI